MKRVLIIGASLLLLLLAACSPEKTARETLDVQVELQTLSGESDFDSSETDLYNDMDGEGLYSGPEDEETESGLEDQDGESIEIIIPGD